MKIGVVFPQIEFPANAAAIREYAQEVEALGFTHILAYDHVLGANPVREGGWKGPYTHENPFMEPFVLFSYMAAVTTTLEFATGIIILPQRQTALVAKQAATLDVLCNGRFRLGIGVGWNKVEYQGLGQDFHRRGRRVEAQIGLLRRLWTEPLITVEDEWHHIPDAGLNPLPVQQPIPIWLGGHADVVLRRVAAMGDGWLPNYREAEDAAEALETLDRYLTENGRSRANIGLEPRLHYQDGDLKRLEKTLNGWRNINASHITLNSMGAGFTTPQQHLAALRRFANALL